jgi:hypothetical protein
MALDCLANTIGHCGIDMYIKELFLPKLPDAVVKEVYQSIELESDRVWNDKELNMYHWIPANDIVQNWCKSNISPDLYWGVQVIDSDLPMHKDRGTQIKFNYIVDQGGINPLTNYHDDQGKLINSYTMEPHAWYILNVTVNHSVTNMLAGKKRISITSRIMP